MESWEAALRAALVRLLRDGVFVASVNGSVVEVNDAFGEITGWVSPGAPYSPPYPWWPAGEDVDKYVFDPAFASMLDKSDSSLEMPFLHRDGRVIWVSVTATTVETPESGSAVIIGTVREITRERSYSDRCGSATRLGAALADHLNLQEVQAAMLHGFDEVFDGEVIIAQVRPGISGLSWPPETVITSNGTMKWADLRPEVQKEFTGAIEGITADTRPGRVRQGILVTSGPDATEQVWVHFPVPRVVWADEFVLAATMAETMGGAIRRAQRMDDANTEAHLRAAIDSHRFIGQAVGILMERHRMTATGAFDRIRASSRNRNMKLRDVADHIITTGEELPG
jgi:hypothetical protein